MTAALVIRPALVQQQQQQELGHALVACMVQQQELGQELVACMVQEQELGHALVVCLVLQRQQQRLGHHLWGLRVVGCHPQPT